MRWDKFNKQQQKIKKKSIAQVYNCAGQFYGYDFDSYVNKGLDELSRGIHGSWNILCVMCMSAHLSHLKV